MNDLNAGMPAHSPEGLPDMGPAELSTLHVRVVALENLLIALLADASDSQRARARAMASYIAPRPGHTEHPLTTHAAAHMSELIDRAQRLEYKPA